MTPNQINSLYISGPTHTLWWTVGSWFSKFPIAQGSKPKLLFKVQDTFKNLFQVVKQ